MVEKDEGTREWDEERGSESCEGTGQRMRGVAAGDLVESAGVTQASSTTTSRLVLESAAVFTTKGESGVGVG